MEKKTFSKEEIEVLNQELFNQIFLEKNYIYEFYSTNELKSLFTYGNYNKGKIYFLLENYTKEENLKKIQDKIMENLNNQNKVQIMKKNQNLIERFIIQSRFYIRRKSFNKSKKSIN